MKKKTIKITELRTRCNLGERAFQNIHCQKANLKDLELHRIDFQGANLDYAKFTNTLLQEASFANAHLASADFQRAQLQQANFQGAYLHGSRFQSSNLQRANLSNTNLRGTEFGKADLQGAPFKGADLLGAYFVEANLKGVDLNEAICNESTHFSKDFDPITAGAYVITFGASLKQANLQEKDLTESNLEEANLEEANLQNANLRGVNLKQANLKNANLQGANLQGANLQKANLQGADLRKAYLKKIAPLEEGIDHRIYRYAGGDTVNLQGADLRGAILPPVEMMEGANLQGADLQGVQLEDGKDLDQYLSTHGLVLTSKTIASSTAKLLNIENLLNPKNLKAVKRRITTSINQRRGQPQFREALLQAYSVRCAVTECNTEEALEAAHILPYSEDGLNHTSNGLLLRADIHTLFDLNLIAIEPETYKIYLAAKLREGSYKELHERILSLPQSKSWWPSKLALQWRWQQCAWIKDCK